MDASSPATATPGPGEGLAARPSLSIRTFGRAEVRAAGTPVGWQAASARDLFFYLLSFPEGRTREQILEDLWGLDPDPASGNRFRVTVHRVRAALGSPAALVETFGRYHLSPEVFRASDVRELYAALHAADHAGTPGERLEAYRRVLAVYAGEYLPHVHAEWARQAREEHRSAYVRACVELSALHCEGADCPAAVGDLTRALRADPFLGENHHQKLMACLSVVEGPYAAVGHYRRFLKFLRDDLGDTPMPETIALAERVKGGEPVCERGRGLPGPSAHRCPLAQDGTCAAGPRDVLQLN